jgi:membrane associated rhomboid family serine protease
MLKPPPLKNIPLYPVTASVAILAIVVTGLWWSGDGIDQFFMDFRVWDEWQLWRAFTSTLPHVNFLHLAFNLYWLWVFGPVLERVYGHLRFAGIVLLLALASGLAEFSVLYGGVGLSGVGYGLWGMLWVLERRGARFTGTVDNQTSITFVIWFFVCIALTVAEILPVGNVAHGAGAVMGALLGSAASSQARRKAVSIAACVFMVLLGLAGSTVLWTRINYSSSAEAEVERAGVDALERKDRGRAIRLLEIAVHMKAAPARAWYNLGIAYHGLEKYDQALAAYEHAAKMPDADSGIRKVAQEMKDYQARLKEHQESHRLK